MTTQQDLNETLGRAVELLNALDDKRAEQIAALEAKVAELERYSHTHWASKHD